MSLKIGLMVCLKIYRKRKRVVWIRKLIMKEKKGLKRLEEQSADIKNRVYKHKFLIELKQPSMRWQIKHLRHILI